MRIFHLFIIFLVLFGCRTVSEHSLSNNDILLSINDNPVTAGEFLYSFNKSHQNSKDSVTVDDVNEYLRLFVNYKLKVAEARKYGYDTTLSYRKELDLYQEQVRSSYRATEKVIDSLVNEAYNRMQYEVNASHLLLRLDKHAAPEDTIEAYNRIMEIRAKDMDFDALALEYSEDPSAKNNKGNLGYFTAFQMLYPFESAAYNTPEGKVSMPVRTQYGYHLVKVHKKRPLVQISLHHIMAPKDEKDPEASAAVVFEAQEMLNKGMSPVQIMESAYARENQLVHKLLKPAEVNRLSPELRVVSESLETTGEVSDPVSTEEGWHIFVVEEKIPLPPQAEIQNQLERMVKSTDRLQLFKEQYIKDLLSKYSYNQHILTENLKKLAGSADNLETTIFTLNGKTYELNDFLSLFGDRDISSVNENEIINRYKKFIEDEVTALEDEALMESNEELKWLLKEYEEGMLLFAVMEDSIWNKAVEDSVGLNNFINQQQANVNNEEKKPLDNKGKWIAAYQELLEQKWVRKLREEHEVMVNQKVLEQVYEKLIN